MTARDPLNGCDTLMLDMDGTLLDLAYDNFMWLTRIPIAYAERHGLPADAARERLFEHYRRLQGKLDWYCLDHWSERLDLDILELHRAERDRIGWLPGAERFLAAVRERGLTVLLVTNAHRDTLDLKSEVTGIARYFERMHSAHDFGFSKEQQGFWQALQEREGFDPQTTVFVDDNETVLDSARRYGVAELLTITRPDTSREPRESRSYEAVSGVAELAV